ncbi:MAG: molybdenum cofactor biosynthesis protein MoaE [Nannocystaceae bacterium]|nr:molybdenum cofactor biosynthesis protein MoaE [bacterium]
MAAVTVLLFAGLREAARAQTVTVDLPEGSTAADLLAAIDAQIPALAGRVGGSRVAVDHAFVRPDAVIDAGSELALIPPVSGGHDGVPRILLSSAPLSLAAVVSVVEHEGAGGLTTFTGNVRLHSRGQRIERLEYEAYAPMATAVMTQIADGIEAEIEGARLAIHHRIGVLGIGETAVVIAASAPHRAEAFAACRAAIERLKDDVPIWKKEVAQSGAAWIGQGP